MSDAAAPGRRAKSPLSILTVNTYERWGGAEAVAANLQGGYRRRGHDAWLAVGHEGDEGAEAFVLPDDADRGRWYRFWTGLAGPGGPSGPSVSTAGPGHPSRGLLRRLARRLATPGRTLDELRGVEDFRYPGTYRLPSLPPRPPDILHAHNLHGHYFDLRALPWLSHQAPLVVTLHDAWLLAGHCAHSFECERWLTGCGHCPDLTIYPAVRRDATAHNWRRKRDIYARSRLFVAAPCRWLLERAEQSILAPAMVESRVIPNGVDLDVFRPAPRDEARRQLDIPAEALVLLFVASGHRANSFKDFPTLQAALSQVGEALDERQVILIALGDEHPPERRGRCELRSVAFEPDPARVARYYQASDLYLHAARAETFPMTILEALACGTPVVATAVGGIPEQIHDLDQRGQAQATGALVAPGEPELLARSVLELVRQPELMGQMGACAARDARRRFDLQQQCDAYLEWYHALLDQSLTRGPARHYNGPRPA